MCLDCTDFPPILLVELIRDPIVQAVMAADGVSEVTLVALVQAVARQRRTWVDAAAEATGYPLSISLPHNVCGFGSGGDHA